MKNSFFGYNSEVKMIVIYNPELSPQMEQNLKQLGYHCIPSIPIPSLPNGIALHPDMQVCPIDEKTILTAPEVFNYYRKVLPDSIQVIPGETPLDGTYPKDSAYNAAEVGEYFFCNTTCIDKKLLHIKKESGKKIIHINQGYAKCNILPFSGKGLFTEDIGIHNTITVNNLPIKSVLLPSGEIFLKNYSYGFIGGSCGKAEKTVIWYGNPDRCSYADLLHQFLKKEDIGEISLSSDKLEDLGGIICLP